MNNDALIQELNKLIEPIVTKLGYELYHIELVKEEGEDFLRIYIENGNGNGISLQDCEAVSRPVSDMLDIEDPITFGYYLEVSSPGMYRTLFTDKHLAKSVGEYILVVLNALFNGKRELTGELVSFDDKDIVINEKGVEIVIPRDKVKNISLTDQEQGGKK